MADQDARLNRLRGKVTNAPFESAVAKRGLFLQNYRDDDAGMRQRFAELLTDHSLAALWDISTFDDFLYQQNLRDVPSDQLAELFTMPIALRQTVKADGSVAEKGKAEEEIPKNLRRATVRRTPSVDPSLVHLRSKVRDLAAARHSQLQICIELDRLAIARPPSAAWRHMKWAEAFKTKIYSGTVRKWLSKNRGIQR